MYMYIIFVSFVVCGISQSKSLLRRKWIGFRQHGPNNWNDKTIYDYGVLRDIHPLFRSESAQIAVYNPWSDKEEIITENTDRNLLLATTSEFWSAAPRDPAAVFKTEWANKPVLETGTLSRSSIDIMDRFEMKSYKNAIFGKPYLDFNTIQTSPTLSKWEEIGGDLEYECYTKTNENIITIKISNAMPNSLYSVWEAGVNQNELALHGAGGLPNVFVTDKDGFGRYKWKQPWCPNECDLHNLDTNKCIAFYAVVMHWDYGVYGNAPALNGLVPIPAPGGVVATTHMRWIADFVKINQEEAQNPFQKSNRHC